jgi:Competence protein
MLIKYQFAKDEKGKLIDINDLDVNDRDDFKFYCVGCGNELIAKLGKIKIHHFAHKKVVACSGETYLHTLGKQLFYDNFTECLTNKKPFFIEIYQKKICIHYEQEFGIKCKLSRSVTKFDLTKYFDKISIETREGSFVADVMLTSKSEKDKVFVEIAVTHLSTEEKLNSNYRIIEIEIANEEDFAPIRKKSLSVYDSKVKFRNFHTKETCASICDGNCSVLHNFLTLDNEGRCLLKQCNLKQIKSILTKQKDRIVTYQIIKIDGRSYFKVFKTAIATFAEKNLKIKNCYICRYHADNNSNHFFEDTRRVPIFCKFLKVKCNSNHAVSCNYFRLEYNYVSEIIQEQQEDEIELKEYYQSESDEDNEDYDWKE